MDAQPVTEAHVRAARFVSSPGDPDQLYDLGPDPLELDNLAARADAPPGLASFRDEAARRWDFGALRRKVVDSQRRRLVADALRLGAPRAGDFQPVRDASQQYMRNHMKLDDLEAAARFPRVGLPGG